MAKKTGAKEPQKTATIPVSAATKSFKLSVDTILPLAGCLLYFAVHFIPNFDAYDAMGSQWLYMVALDIVVTLFILARKNHYELGTFKVFNNTFSKLYLAVFILAGLSIFTAINPTEGWVCYVRMIATVVAYFNISILLYGRTDLFKMLAQVLSLILLFESWQTISQFINDSSTISLEEVIMSLKGTAGNKNIFAAGLVVKVPFVIYCIYTFNIWGKLLNMVIFVIGVLAIFIINARAAYLSLFLILLMYLAFCIINYLKDRKLEQGLSRIGFVLLPVIIAFFVSEVQLNSVKSVQDDKAGKDFGSVTERLASVTQTNDESNQVRFRLWQHAIDYTKHHPIIGSGIGNWKIASIPYQRTITNDLYVPVHAHNDFLEVFAELGIPGGLLYLSLFICVIVFTYKTFYSKADEETKLIAVFSLMAFTGYAVDALFNFPLERPISQVFFAFIVAVNIGAYIKGREEQAETEEKDAIQRTTAFKPLFGLVAFLFLIPSLYVTYLTYKSLIVQRSVLGDLNNEPLKLDWKVIVPSFPSIPNLTATAQPVEAIKGRYLYEVGKYDEAMVLLDKGQKANPVIGYSEFLKAGVYFRLGKFDSARRNALVAFDLRPKAKTYFQTLIAVLAKLKDTIAIKKAFVEFDRYRHWAYGYNLYLLGMLNAERDLSLPERKNAAKELLVMADSALHMFPTELEAKDVMTRKEEIVRILQAQIMPTVTATQLTEAQKYYAAGVAAFGTGVAGKDDLKKAASLFIKAGSLSPGDYTIFENAAMCYFNMQDFKTALTYFDKALAIGTSTNGKSEFFKGVALINLGKKDEGCSALKISKSKNYKEKEAELNTILKERCGQ